MTIKLVSFGSLSEIIPEQNLTIEPTVTTAELVRRLYRIYPRLKKCRFVIAVNQEISTKPVKLKDADEVAFLAPFAGG
jgi:molybdopterin converting factor small subunit